MNKISNHILKLAGLFNEGLDFTQENNDRLKDLQNALSRAQSGEEGLRMLYKWSRTGEITEEEFLTLIKS